MGGKADVFEFAGKGKTIWSSDLLGAKVSPRCRPQWRCCSVRSSSSVLASALLCDICTMQTSSTYKVLVASAG